MLNDLNKFMIQVKNANGPRNHIAKNSYDTKDFYRNYIKGLDKNSDLFITERKYGEIIKVTNDIIKERLLDGCQVVFPYGLGSLQIESHENTIKIVNGTIHTSYMIDWNETIKLWFSDNECRKKKTLVRNDNPLRYVVQYRRPKIPMANKQCICFLPCRDLTGKINTKMKEEGLNVIPR